MCDPVSMTVMAVTSMGMTAYSGYMQGRTQRAQGIAQGNYYDYLARQNELEAQEALKQGNLQAKMIQDVGKEEMKALKREQAQLSSSQIAKMVAQGLDISSVSAQDISTSTYDTQRLDELALAYNNDIKTWGVQTEASYKDWSLRTQAESNRYAGRYARQAGRIAMKNTYLKTGASLLGQAVTFGTSGVFGGGGSTQGLTGWLKGYKNAPVNTYDTGKMTLLLR